MNKGERKMTSAIIPKIVESTSFHIKPVRNHLSNTMIRTTTPSAFATQPAEWVSDKYSFVPTIKVIDALRDSGWFPTQAVETKSRFEKTIGFQKHMIRFSRADFYDSEKRIELVLTNGHNAMTSFKLQAGVYRLVCSNGLIVGQDSMKFVHPHIGFQIEDLLTSVTSISQSANVIYEMIDVFKNTKMTTTQSLSLSSKIAEFVWPETACISLAKNLLMSRRIEDSTNNLWTTTNIIQENVMKGGIKTKKSKTRGISNIQKTVSVNEFIWKSACGFTQ